MSESKFREFPGCVTEMKDLHNLPFFANPVIDHDGAMYKLTHSVRFWIVLPIRGKRVSNST
jgi:hypothetical protein